MVIVAYALTAVAVRTGALDALVAVDPGTPVVTDTQEVAFYSGPSAESWTRWLGTDRQGRSILLRAIWSIDVAVVVGTVTGLAAVVIGTLLGCIAGYFGGRVDATIVWLYSTVESIPYLLLLLVLSYSTDLFFDRLPPAHRVVVDPERGVGDYAASIGLDACSSARGSRPSRSRASSSSASPSARPSGRAPAASSAARRSGCGTASS